MKLTTKDCCIIRDPTTSKNYFNMILPTKDVDKWQDIVDKEGLKTVEIKQKRKGRSLNANNYFWQMCNKIANKLDSTDDEIYNRMLRDWGTKEYVAVIPDAIPMLKKAYKIVEIVSNVNVQGKKAVQVRLIRGSSTYDTKEMSRLINGLVEEAKILGIETLTPNEVNAMMENYKEG